MWGGSPSYRRTRESLEVMRSCEGSCGRNCIPVIFRPRAVLPLRFFTSAPAHSASGVCKLPDARGCMGMCGCHSALWHSNIWQGVHTAQAQVTCMSGAL